MTTANGHRPFRFAALCHMARTRAEWVAKAQHVERLGYSALYVVDRIPIPVAPLLGLLSAAAATTTLRVGTFVINNDLRHPALLAKEAATLDLLSDGRLELGLGAGWVVADYEQIGLPFEPAAVRIARLEEAVEILKRAFTDEVVSFSGRHYTVSGLRGFPKPVQRPHPPILIGGKGKRMLSVAAREADIVDVLGIDRLTPEGPDLGGATAEAFDERVRWVMEAAGPRISSLELGAIVWSVCVTDRRMEMLAQGSGWVGLTPEQASESPGVLVGTIDQISEQLVARRARFGFSHITVMEQDMDSLAPVVSRLSGH